MTEAAEQLEPMEVPAGGIGEFVKTDEEIEALEREEADLEFGNDGIAYFNDVAGKMAGYGRFGDDSIAHIETGEIVVPKALIENNPRLKEQIFAELREAGIEDPEQYVVGSKANSINPETGLMEFGFLKKIFKGVGKVFKGIGKVLKKAATIILPVALSFIMPPAAAAMLGTGIGTLIQGGSFKDALKTSLISGLTAGVFKGVTSKLGGEGFKTGFREAFTGPQAAAAAGTDALTKAPQVETVTDDVLGDVTKVGPETPGASLQTPSATDAFRDGQLMKTSGTFDPAGEVLYDSAYTEALALERATEGAKYVRGLDPKLSNVLTESEKNILSKAVTAGDDATKTIILDNAQNKLAEQAAKQGTVRTIGQVLRDSDKQFFGPEGKLKELFTPKGFYGKDADLGLFRRFGPGAALATGIMGATGGFKVPEQEDPGLFPRDEFGNPITGASMIRQDPGAYLISDIGDLYLDPETGTYKRKGRQDETLVSEMLRARTPEQGPMMAADGGDVEYPRRFGGIMPEEGVPDEDSVPALLMPGEFVMTTGAVKGMGDGDMTTGISRMYDVMSRLEKRGRQVA
jgi:uncharacterized membrane protein (UPF0136 family)